MNNDRQFTFPVRLTKAVQESFKRFGLGETGFLTMQEVFPVIIEKNKENGQAKTKVLLYFTHLNVDVSKTLNGKLPVLTVIMEDHVMTAVHVMLKSGKSVPETNWRRATKLTFIPDKQIKTPLSHVFRNWLADLPYANERSEYVRKRIAGWEGYLTIQEQQADIADIRFSFKELGIQKDFRRLMLYEVKLTAEQWKKVKDLDVKFPAIGRELGKVIKGNAKAGTLEIEINSYMEETVRKTAPERFGQEAILSNFASLSQIRRLRSGFQQLEKGQAENPLLEQILFEESPPVAPLKPLSKLTYHHPLNEFQKRAVEGACAAQDLYVIQGPPGTGKTTVISEICLQNAKAGLRTLVASQSNLAVDNALSRLLANKDIRILRVGRTESIEEEGKRFIEENIGSYWRDVTLQTITSTVSDRALRLEKMKEELHEIRPQFEESQHFVNIWQEKVQQKKVAVTQLENIKNQLVELQIKIARFEEQKMTLQKEKEEYRAQLEVIEAKRVAEEERKNNFPNPEQLEQQMTMLLKQISHTEYLLELRLIHEERLKIQQQLQETTETLRKLEEQVEGVQQSQERLSRISKVADIQMLLEAQPAYQTPRILFKLKGIEGIRTLMKTYFPAKERMERYDKALTFFTEKLGEKKRPIRAQMEPVYVKEELDTYLDQGRFWLKTQQLPSEKELGEYVQGLYQRMRYMAEIVRRYEDLTSRGEQELSLLRTQLMEIDRSKFQQELRTKAALEINYQELVTFDEKLTETWVEKQGERFINELQDIDETSKFALERQARELKKLRQEMTEFDTVYTGICEKCDDAKRLVEQSEMIWNDFLESSTSYESDHTRLTNEIQILQPLADERPEEQLEEFQKQWLRLQFRVDALEKENLEAPLHQKLQSQWQGLLEKASAEDVDEIRKLNVKYANVIGTTCVASARKDFMENYPSFDVVIIDEVSKATPPELLLPMLKGKKVILVGDHHQLPPLLGDDTLEEVLEQLVTKQDEFTGKQEVERLLKESLFERLYRNLPDTHKTMLAIQYRMHEAIMQTITPFYRFDQDELQCGLDDSDVSRAHALETDWLKQNEHLLWIDLPHHPAYFEERVKGGKSLWNPSEMNVMRKTLIDLNEAVKKAKSEGRLPEEYQKSVGIISFYGEQVKQLNRLIQQELRLPHITMRTGTVDRFQGMEMEVILLSMVRNHDEGRGDIGFANDYRRLNVALSRAKELLVVIGSHTMFTEKVKRQSTKDMYQHVWNMVEQRGGARKPEEVLGYVEVAN